MSAATLTPLGKCYFLFRQVFDMIVCAAGLSVGAGAGAPPLICPSAPPSCSPESTTKRRSLVSSDTNSTKSSHKDQTQVTHKLSS